MSYIDDTINRYSLSSARPNEKLLEEVLSLDATGLDLIPKERILKYMVVLSQQLYSLKHAENLNIAISSNLNKVLENKIYYLSLQFDNLYPKYKKATVKEKRSCIINDSTDLSKLEEEAIEASTKADLLSGMTKPIEEFIQVLKKFLDHNPGEI